MKRITLKSRRRLPSLLVIATLVFVLVNLFLYLDKGRRGPAHALIVSEHINQHNKTRVNTTGSLNVLVVSNMRTGSSYIARELFAKNPNIFYVYEPLDGIYSAMYGTTGGLNIPSDITTHKNGSVREIPEYERDAMAWTLRTTFNCDTLSFPFQLALHKFWDYFSYEMPKVGPYVNCLRKRGWGYKRAEKCRAFINSTCPTGFGNRDRTVDDVCLQALWYKNLDKAANIPGALTGFSSYDTCIDNSVNLHMPECLPTLKKVCSKQHIRVIKTVRATMDVVVTLLEADPGLKVIHHIRDPRGVIKSRRRLWWTQGAYEMSIAKNQPVAKVEAIAKVLCEHLEQQIRERLELQLRYPGRIMELRFDQFITEHIEGTREVYDFLNLKIPEVIHKNMEKHQEQAKNSTTSGATNWEKHFNQLGIQAIDKHCSGLLSYLESGNI